MRSVDKVTSQVEMSLRKGGVVKKDAQLDLPSLAEANLSVGQVVRGVVKRVEDFGAFIRLDGLNVQGLCHKSKVSDETSGSWKEHVRSGDKVKAVVLDVNLETKKLSLGLKKSLFPEGEVPDEDDEDEEEGDEEEEVIGGLDAEEEDDDEDDEDEEDAAASDEGEEIDLQAMLNGAGVSEDSGDDDEDAEMDDGDEPEVRRRR